MLLSVLLILAPETAPKATPPLTPAELGLRDCGAGQGPVAWSTKTEPGKNGPDRWAIACSRHEITRLTIFARLPSGQQGAMCDVGDIAGVPHALVIEPVKDKTLLRLQTIERSPEEERVIEQLVAARWGHCEVIVKSDVRHPTDGPTLLEPSAGIVIDAEGIDAWQGVTRLYFATPRRHVATALHGTHLNPDTWASQSIDAPQVEAVPATFPTRLAAHETASVEWTNAIAVRGVKLRLRENKHAKRLLVLESEATTITWRSDANEWQTAPGVFGAGFMPRAAGDATREAIVFFDPPQTLTHFTLRGGDAEIEIVQGQVFSDAPDNEPFEQSEDFGEHYAN